MTRPYNEFVEKMKKDGYIRKNNDAIHIDDSNIIITKYRVKKDTIGKFLELSCPNNTIITHCGDRMNCGKKYEFRIKCYDENMKEPFSNPLRSSLLLSKKTKKLPGLIVNYQIIITKIGERFYNLEPGWEKYVKMALRIIDSQNPNEYPLYSGEYMTMNLALGIYLEEGQKLVFYAIEPERDIKNIDLKMDIDIFEKN